MEDLLCVCGGSALLGDLLGLSMFMQCDFLPVLSYSRFVLSVFLCIVFY